jgi:hypothetical protein
VLGSHVVVAERVGLLLRMNDQLARARGEAVKRLRAGPSPPPQKPLEECLACLGRNLFARARVDDLMDALMAEPEAVGDLAKRSAGDVEPPDRVVVLGTRPLDLVLKIHEAIAGLDRRAENLCVEHAPSSVLDKARWRLGG